MNKNDETKIIKLKGLKNYLQRSNSIPPQNLNDLSKNREIWYVVYTW